MVSKIRKTGKLFESYFTVEFEIVNGKIKKYLMLEDSFNLIEALKSENSEKEKLDIVKTYFKKLNAGDLTYFDLFSDDFEFYFPKFGITKGKEPFKEFGRRLNLRSITHAIGDFTYYIDGNTVVVEGQEKGITKRGEHWPDNKVSQGLFTAIFTIKDKQIIRFYIYADPDVTSADTDRVNQLFSGKL